MTDTTDQARDDLGRHIDTIDNLVAALSVPLPPTIHLQALRGALLQLSADFKAAYVACFGENPWE